MMKTRDQHFLEEAYQKILLEKDYWESSIQPYRYKGRNPTVDLVIFYKSQVLLIKRKEWGVEGGKWAIPGGFVDTKAKKGEEFRFDKETPRQAALREVLEETHLDLNKIPYGISRLKEVGIYEGNSRDPRDNKESWSRSYVFTLALKEEDGIDFSQIQEGDDASEAQWFSLKNLPTPLAFDHSKILHDALIIINK